ncbi:MAG TPA: hypothetical protein VMX74_02735 [Pirellulales bacterium]|nr:hypothetical protein [Pirellulales bacterium]
MVRCSELCKSCSGKCREIVSPEFPAEVECPVCDGDGCEECNDGYFQFTECPSKFIGPELISDIQIVTASEQHLPVVGGLLDQSAWWFELRQLLKSEENRIQEEQQKRRH